MENVVLKATCLSISLATAWAPSTTAEVLSEVHYESSFSGNITHARVLMKGLGSGSNGQEFRGLTIPGSGSGFFSSDSPVEVFGSNYSVIGLGSGHSGNPMDLVVGVGNGSGFVGVPFESVFPGVSEAAIIESLLNETPTADAFLLNQFNRLSQPVGFETPLVSYSNGVSTGFFRITSVVAVPEPVMLGAMPILLLIARRRHNGERPPAHCGQTLDS